MNLQTDSVIAFEQCQIHNLVPDETLPDWVSIYFVKNTVTEYRCNICEGIVNTKEKSLELLEHIKDNHKEVFDLHKENPEATVGFRIEFLHLNVMKDDGELKTQPVILNVLKDDGDPKTQPVILGEVCEATTEEIVEPATEKDIEVPSIGDIVPKKRKSKNVSEDSRKRSWVWKYFQKMSNIIFRCNLCEVVLSIKGCNTNNMNRHIKSRHPSIFISETEKKKVDTTEQFEIEVETPFAVKTEEICASDKEVDESIESPGQRHRRSWIWMYFNRTSATTAQCKLCSRNICHGGNATGNMNRHLKMIHQKTGDDYSWIWKVFDNDDKDFYSCKICQYRCMKFNDVDKSIALIVNHLSEEHGVVSGDQIITGTEGCDVEAEN